MTQPSQNVIDALLAAMPEPVRVWNRSSEPPVEITFRFENFQPVDMDTLYHGWTAFTAAQKNVVRAVLAEYASMINVTFHEVDITAPDPDLNLGRVDLGYDGYGGYRYAYFADGQGLVSVKKLDGFAVFSNKLATLDRDLVFHELGHALTMKHPGRYASDDSAEGPYLPGREDNAKYTVMSYNANPDNHAFSGHLMLYDIAALQARFGANLSYRTGDDVYRGPEGLIQAIWDAGGTDTFDAGRIRSAVTINLVDGQFSSLGAKNNLAIAYGVVIENATGGSGGDKLIGNEWSNVLKGGSGKDKLSGGAGADTLAGGKGADILNGGDGADAFLFNAGLGAKSNVDAIRRFAPADDVILLENAVFKTLAAGALADSDFHVGSKAHDSSVHIIYNRSSGALIYDKNGNGAGGAVEFAHLKAGLDLTSADFFVV